MTGNKTVVGCTAVMSKKTNTSTPPDVAVIVGAVAAAQSTLPGHVIVRAEES